MRKNSGNRNGVCRYVRAYIPLENSFFLNSIDNTELLAIPDVMIAKQFGWYFFIARMNGWDKLHSRQTKNMIFHRKQNVLMTSW